MSNLRDTRRESAARRALGAASVEARRAVIVETIGPEEADSAGDEITPRYTRRGYKAQPGKRLWEATSSSGYISVRASALEMRWATNVIDMGGATPRQRQGRIRSFFHNRDEALRQADEMREQGYMVTIVEARPYAGQPGDVDA